MMKKTQNIHVAKADLHGHTVNSDGELTVLEIIEEAKSKGLDIYSITDHDCLKGADEAYFLSKERDLGINIIYGIELSTYRNGESVHILGYFKDRIENTPLNELLINQARLRKERAYKMFDLLEEKFGIVLDRKTIEERPSMTRGTMANMIMAAGYNYSRGEIFSKLIGDGCPCYLPSSKLDTKDGIRIIKESGGIAVLAHPCLLEHNYAEDIINLGIDGIEVIYPSVKNRETKYRDLARKNGLVVTGGSDFHFKNDKRHGEIGSCVIKGREVKAFLIRLNK